MGSEILGFGMRWTKTSLYVDTVNIFVRYFRLNCFRLLCLVIVACIDVKSSD